MVFYAQQKVETTRNNKLKTAQETDEKFIQAKSGKRKIKKKKQNKTKRQILIKIKYYKIQSKMLFAFSKDFSA